MSDVCFSGSALVLLGSIAGVVQAMVIALFLALRKANEDSIKDARSERDRATGNLEQALQIGETAVGEPRVPRRRA